MTRLGHYRIAAIALHPYWAAFPNGRSYCFSDSARGKTGLPVCSEQSRTEPRRLARSRGDLIRTAAIR